MNSALFSALFVIAAAPVADAPLPITVTRRGRQTLAAHNAPVPRVRERCAVDVEPTEADLIEAHMIGNPESYPTDAELAAMRAQAAADYDAQFPPCADDTDDDYPTLAERLAADLRYESRRA